MHLPRSNILIAPSNLHLTGVTMTVTYMIQNIVCSIQLPRSIFNTKIKHRKLNMSGKMLGFDIEMITFELNPSHGKWSFNLFSMLNNRSDWSNIKHLKLNDSKANIHTWHPFDVPRAAFVRYLHHSSKETKYCKAVGWLFAVNLFEYARVSVPKIIGRYTRVLFVRDETKQ